MQERKFSLVDALGQIAEVHLAKALGLPVEDMPESSRPSHKKLPDADLQPNGKLVSDRDIALLEWYFDHLEDSEDELIERLVPTLVAWLEKIMPQVEGNTDIMLEASECGRLRKERAHLIGIIEEKGARKKIDAEWAKVANKLRALVDPDRTEEKFDALSSGTQDAINMAAKKVANRIILARRKLKKNNRNVKDVLHGIPGLMCVKFSVIHLEDGSLFALGKGAKYGLMLGEGYFGKVKLAQDLKTGELVAIKITKKEKHVANNLQEAEILKKMKRYRGSYLRGDSKNSKLEVAMQLELGDELFEFLADHRNNRQPLKIRDIRCIVCNSIHALMEWHASGILHCDVKTANALYDRKTGKVSLVDPGYAIDSSNPVSNRIVGTFRLIAPEVFIQFMINTNEITYTPAMDVFALGTDLGNMLGLMKTDTVTKGLLWVDRKSSKYTENLMLADLDDESKELLYDLLKGMTDPNPDKRLTLPAALQRAEAIPAFSFLGEEKRLDESKSEMEFARDPEECLEELREMISNSKNLRLSTKKGLKILLALMEEMRISDPVELFDMWIHEWKLAREDNRIFRDHPLLLLQSLDVPSDRDLHGIYKPQPGEHTVVIHLLMKIFSEDMIEAKLLEAGKSATTTHPSNPGYNS